MFDDADEFETRSGDEWVELGPSMSAAAAASAAKGTATGTSTGTDADHTATSAASPAAAPGVGKPTTGRSLFYLHPHFVWLPCEVLAWDADQQRFLVSFFSEAEMRASKDMQPALEELVQVRQFIFSDFSDFFGFFFQIFYLNFFSEFFENIVFTLCCQNRF